jgi:hypothetical protein
VPHALRCPAVIRVRVVDHGCSQICGEPRLL